jgi:two-component system, sensor histidine kinase and response regulator
LQPIPSFAGTSILLVEDNPINQEVALEMLQKTKATVTIATNGREAVELTHTQNFDLILMDLQMPVMDGLEATRRIRAVEAEGQGSEVGDQVSGVSPRPSRHRTPIIALTAAVMEADRHKAQNAGMDGHLAKPINSAQLYRSLSRWLAPQGDVPRRTGTDSSSETRGSQDKLPEALAGVNLVQGLSGFDGNTEFYLKILRIFKEQVAQASVLP